MEKQFKMRHVNEFVGLFVIGVIALVIAGVLFSSHSQRWFARKFAFDVLLPEAGSYGLRRGDEVFILGVSAGLVDDVLVQEDGRVKAQVKIRRDFERFVRADSTASIKKAFAVAGDSFMEITRGTGDALKGKTPTIICIPSEDSLGRMEKMVSDLHAELIPVIKKTGVGLDEWTNLGAGLRATSSELDGLFARWDGLAEDLENGKGIAGKLLKDDALADDAQKILLQASEIVAQFQIMAANLNSAVTNIQAGAARLPEIADAVAGETRDLPGLVHQTKISMVELERLIVALQRHWFVRKNIDPANPPSLRPPSDLPTAEPKRTRIVRSPKGSQ